MIDQDIKEFSTKDSADKDVFEGALTNYYTKKPLFYPEEYREAADALVLAFLLIVSKFVWHVNVYEKFSIWISHHEGIVMVDINCDFLV